MATVGECAACKEAIRKQQQRLECILANGGCDTMFHRTCLPEITQEAYRAWKKDGTIEEWKCHTCRSKEQMEVCPPTSTDCPTTSTVCPPTSTDCPTTSTVCPPTSTVSPPTSVSQKHITVREIGNDFVTLAWKPTTDQNMRGDVIYSVSYQEKSENGRHLSSQIFKLGEFLVCKVQSLSPGKEYQFFAETRNSAGLVECLSTETFVKTTEVQLCPPTSTECPTTSTVCPPTSTVCPPTSTVSPPTSVSQKHITVREIGNDFVTLAWKPTTDQNMRGDVIYSLSYQEKSENGRHLSSQIFKLGEFLVCKVQSLSPGKEYQFFAETRNSAGLVECLSTETFVKTTEVQAIPLPPQRPPQPLGPLEVRDTGIDFVVLKWKPAVETELHGTVTYMVEYGKRGDKSGCKSAAKSFLLGEYVICKVENLSPGTEYLFWVTAKNDTGMSDNLYCENFVRTKPEKAIPLPPQRPPQPLGPLEVRDTGIDFVVLKWKPAVETELHGTVTYMVEYGKRGDKSGCKSAAKSFLLGEYVICKVENLSPGTEYLFWVTAKNDTGMSDNLYCDNFVRTKPEKVPTEAPTWVKLEPCGPGKLRVSWSLLGADNNEGIDKYQVKKSSNNKDWETVTETQSFNLDSVVIDDNFEGKHWIGVAAANEAGSGPLCTELVPVKAPTKAPSTVLLEWCDGKLNVWWRLLSGRDTEGIEKYVVKKSCNHEDWDTVMETWSCFTDSVVIDDKFEGKHWIGVAAMNEAGTGPLCTMQIPAKVLLPTEAPSSLTLEPCLSGKLRVSWSLLCADKNEGIYKYLVKKSSNNKDWETVVETLSCFTDSVVIDDNFEGKNWIGVAAMNEAGTGPLCTMQIPAKAPTKAPTAVFVEQCEPGKLKVRWSLLSTDTGGSNRCVVMKSSNNKDWDTVTEALSSFTHSVVIDDTFVGKHWIGVAAINEAGTGPLCTMQIPAKVPTEAPSWVTVKPCEPGKLRVSWSLLSADNNGGIDKYHVKKSSNNKDWVTVSETLYCTSSLVIGHLLEGQHWIGVAAANEAGSGPVCSVLYTAKVPQSCPEAKRDPMPDLPFFKVIKHLIETQPIEYDNKSKSYAFRIARPRNDSGFKVQLRFCRRKSMMSKGDDINEMPQSGLAIYINSKKAWPSKLSFSVDLTKKCRAEPIDVTSMCTGGDTKNDLYLLGNCSSYLKGFCFALRLVEELTPEQLCKNMVQDQLQPAEETRTAVKAQLIGDGDCDLAATSVHASLRCPIAKTRLRYPCRSKFCSHIQCLDALTMVSMNAKKTTWSCMVCSVSCVYGDLVIDSLFMEILKTVPDTITDVEFRKDGSWTYKGNKSDKPSQDPEMSIIELDLSRTLEMIDLTETDDENSPKPKARKESSTSAPKNKLPLKMNTVLMNTNISSQSRADKLGENYQHSSTTTCHRNNRNHQSYIRNRNKRPYQRSNRPYERYNHNHGGHSNYNNGAYITSYISRDDASNYYRSSSYHDRYNFAQAVQGRY